MEWLQQIATFGVKSVIIAVVIGALIILIAGLIQRRKRQDWGEVEIRNLNEHYRYLSDTIRSFVYDKKAWKAYKKANKEKVAADPRKRVYVLDFEGDIAATAVSELRETVSTILPVLEEGDEVIVRLESSGGMVHAYGLAAGQLARFRERGIPLTVCVDKVAASGGYMMACQGSKLIAAPFAVIGSIGVIAMIPNFHRLLKKYDVDYLELTAGEFKRTLSTFGEITDKGKAKFLQELEEAHSLFKTYVSENRPQLDVAKVATGEHWYGTDALKLDLIDAIQTSDDYLMSLTDSADLFHVSYQVPKSVKEKITGMVEDATDGLLMRWWSRLRNGNRF